MKQGRKVGNRLKNENQRNYQERKTAEKEGIHFTCGLEPNSQLF